MKKLLFIIVAAVPITAYALCQAGQKDFPLLKGPYLGQTVPGTIPEVFAPGVISTDQFEFGGTFSPEGKEFFFTRRPDYEGSENRIYYTRSVDGIWTRPALAPFARDCFEFLPVITPAGDRLFFYSERARPETAGVDGDLWYCINGTGGWSQANLFESPINRKYCMIITSTKTGRFYFAGIFNKKRGIFRSRFDGKTFSEFEYLPHDVNSLGPAHPFIARDESYLIFDAQVSGRGKPELFICFSNPDGSWSKPRNMGPEINATRTEFAASVSPDEKFLFFHRRVNGNGDIYWVSTDVINNLRPKE